MDGILKLEMYNLPTIRNNHNSKILMFKMFLFFGTTIQCVG